MSAGLTLRVFDSICDLPAASWNALLDERSTPFLHHAWLSALEQSGCVSAETGWRPRHLGLFRPPQRPGEVERLVAAAPAYACDGSDGDFSRDWGWAEAASRARIRYYPKHQLTVPFTPCTGRRLLVAAGEDRAACARQLVEGALALAKDEACGAFNVLFPDEDELPAYTRASMIPRVAYQFHWTNEGYRTPEEFLSRFDSKRRNQLKRERAAPAKQGITIRTVRGDELSADPKSWARAVHTLHRSTVEKLAWGRGWLNLDFYQRIFATYAERLEVVEARRSDRGKSILVAGAFNVASPTHLYGRYWGCHEEHAFLHFNVCLYHSLDECIARGVRVFEGGAGGEHKLGRGFLPTETYGAHQMFDARLAAAVRDSLEKENLSLREALVRWREESPVLKKAERMVNKVESHG